MRTEKQMLDLILETAQKDDRIRGVYMEGSRANSKVKRDIFQDYDIVYVVRETASFINDDSWIDVFGQRLYMQMPEKMDVIRGYDCDTEQTYGYLIQLVDGNRIDIHVSIVENCIQDIMSDKLCRILLDKDDALPKPLLGDDSHRWVKKPRAVDFFCCCNEFWWLLNNVGKGIWRGEIPYVMDMINFYVRKELMLMVSWDIGIRTDFSVSIGKSGKYLKDFMPQEEYECFIASYPSGEEEKIWDAVDGICQLFSEISDRVAEKLGFDIDHKEAYNSRLFLDCTRLLPRDAKEIFMVRRMRPRDSSILADIWLEGNVQAHDFIDPGYWKDYYDKIQSDLCDAECYVYEDCEGIHGFAGICEGKIEGLFVRSQSRSKGIGSKLLQVCKAYHNRLTLRVYDENERAKRFYLKEGFHKVEKETDDRTGCRQWKMEWEKE